MNLLIAEAGLKSSTSFVGNFLHSFLTKIGIPDSWASSVTTLILVAAMIVIVVAVERFIHYMMRMILNKAHQVSKQTIFKYAINNRLPHFIGMFFAYVIFVNLLPIAFENYPSWSKVLGKLADVYMVLLIIWTIVSIIKSFIDLLQEKPAFRQKPMQSYLQVVQIVLYLFGAVAIFSILTGKSATVFFTAMGAASAVLLLVFKDTIMGFVSSIQITTNQMVMIGDWITMSKFGADGDVEEITLTTVKVRNFDNTITTIPTYALISDSFQNWRGMQDSGGRRIKRSLFVNQRDIRPATQEELDKFKETDALRDYILLKTQKYNELNEKLKMGTDFPIKGYQITNCDLFMNYAAWFLRNHPEIHQEMVQIVRHMTPASEGLGLPIEIYAFTNTTVWVQYERIYGEVFNHLIAAIGTFGLSIYELPAGTDQFKVSMNN